MFQVRFHGRGGQGVVTAAEMLSVAAFHEGQHAQAFPSFGSERMGAPVVSFCRLSEREIRLRDPVFEPDALVIQDPTLLQSPGVFAGLKADGYVLINSAHDAASLGLGAVLARLPQGHVMTLPATEIALRNIKRPTPNTVMLGGLAALAGVIRLKSVAGAIREVFSGPIAEANVAAASEAFDLVARKRDEHDILPEEEPIAC